MPRAAATDVLSHWYHLVEGLQASPKEFYTAVEHAIEQHKLPDAKRHRIDWSEGGIFTAKREYLRVTRKHLVFDICGAPFGTGFFVSWWLGNKSSSLRTLILAIPVLGRIWEALFPDTYYKHDTALMFQASVGNIVSEIVDEMATAKGLRTLSELERRPILRELSNHS